MREGIYESLVTQLIFEKIESLERDAFYINKSVLDKEEAATILSKHLASTIKNALNYIKGKDQLELQIKIANKIILFLKEELNREEFSDDLILAEGEILKAVFTKIDAHFSDFDVHLKEITPYTRLTHSELFTGGNVGLSLESELKKKFCPQIKLIYWYRSLNSKGLLFWNLN